jgi:hypothetical protein
VSQPLAERRARLLAAWLDHLDPGREPRATLASELDGWLTLFLDAAAGDGAAREELAALVALAARRLAGEGRAASTAVLRCLALEDALFAVLGPDHGLDRLARDLVRIAADAHQVGHGERERERMKRRLIDASPVLRVGERAVVGFVLGSMDADTVDALMGRVLRVAVGSDAPLLVIDVAGAPPDDDLFHRTLRGFVASEHAHRRRLVVTGLRDPVRTRGALTALGVPEGRVELRGDLGATLEALLGGPAAG